MATNLFLCVLDMSRTASLVILFVMALRLPLKRLPKAFSYGLWSVVLFRLLCPVSFERPFGLLPAESRLLLPQGLTAGAAPMGQDAVPLLPAQAAAGISHSGAWLPLAAWLWVGGAAVFLIYNLAALIRLRRKLVGAVRVRANVYLADGIATPFVMGVFRPRIYLPSGIEAEDRRFVELHEEMHLRYGHHIAKLIASAALALHWFNSLVWASFFLAGRDMEMMCDEGVLRHAGGDVRRRYAQTILHLAVGKRRVVTLPVAFGEGDAGARVKNILSCHKIAAWAGVPIAVLLALIGLGLLCDRPGGQGEYIQFPAYQGEETEYNAHVYDIAPFRMYIDLPDGWEVRLPPEAGPGDLFFTPVCRCRDDAVMAVCGYNTFEDLDESEVPPGDYYKVVYSAIRLGSLYRWDDYQPIAASEQGETALANVYLQQTEGAASAAAGSTVVMPGILSYDKQLQVYVAVQFSPGAVTEAERMRIAESIRLSP